MDDRHEVVRRVCVEGYSALADVVTPDLEREDDTGLGLYVLRETFFPELAVEVHEVFDAPGERVVARLTVRAGPAPDAPAWPAVQFFRFRGEQIAAIWSLQDPLPWLQALDVVDGDEIERRLDGRRGAR